MATLKFIVIENSNLYNSTGAQREEVLKDSILECDEWIWDNGVLLGMRKVYTINGLPISNRFIKDSDIMLFNDIPTQPPSTWPAYFILENPETGERQRYNRV